MTDLAEPTTLTGFVTPTGEELDVAERDLLAHLGTGVLAHWDHLPRDVQKAIFNAAVETEPRDAHRLKTDIALFLHEYGHPLKN